MDDTFDTVREIPIRESLPPTAVRGMADYVKTYYLDTRLESLSDRSYRETWSQDGKSVELEWVPMQPGEGAQGASPPPKIVAQLSIGSESISIAFSGVDVADESARLACGKVADDLEMLVTTFITRAKTTSLYFVLSTGEQHNVTDAPAPSRSLGREALRRLISGNMMNVYLLIMAASFDTPDCRLFALHISYLHRRADHRLPRGIGARGEQTAVEITINHRKMA